jgi:hypothetical protein
MKVFHEPPNIARTLLLAVIANFQNYFIPLILGIVLKYIVLPYPLFTISAIIWIFLVKLAFPYVSWQHAIAIGLLCFTTHMIFEVKGLNF